MKKLTHKRLCFFNLGVSNYKVKFAAVFLSAYCLNLNAVTLTENSNNHTVIKVVSDKQIKTPTQSQVIGTVTDENGVPLPGTNVLEKGTTNGAQTDFDGNFSLEVGKNAVLVVSYLGYITKEVPVNGQSKMTIVLKEDVSSLDEVVVIGYGTKSKRDITGAIASVGGDELKEQSVASFDQALSGRAAGVQVVQNSGAPGGGVSIRIRGVGTPGNSEPLYVIDGVPVFNDNNGRGISAGQSGNVLSTINPNDIESIDILKDASSAAIYGSRAANGVVLITTKRGKSGRTKVNIDVYGGIQTPARSVDVLDGPAYAQFINELEGTVPVNPADTNWFDEIYGSAPIRNAQVSISGGNEKSTYALSFGNFKQDGIVKNSDFERWSVRMNSDHKLGENNKIRVGNSFTASRTFENGTLTDDPNRGVTSLALVFPSVIPVYDENGDYAGPPSVGITFPRLNPMAIADKIIFENQKVRMLGNVYGEYDILNGLTYRLNLGADFLYGGSNNFNPGVAVPGGPPLPQLSQRFDSNELIFLVENTLTYNKTFNDAHNLNVLAGFTRQHSQYESHLGSRDGYITDNLYYLSAGTSNPNALGNGFEWGLQSYLGRLSYDYMGKYLFSASVRRDGSSRFGPGRKYGTFPSVSAGWRISDEAFFEPLTNVINDLKFKASWGKLGNQEVDPFQYSSILKNTASYVFGVDQSAVTGIYPGNLANPDVSWETTAQTDFGFDATLFDYALTIGFDYYKRETSDILLPIPVPSSFGYANNSVSVTPIVNAGTVVNKGIELSLGYRHQGDKVQWDVNANLTTVDNEVTSLGGGEPIFGGDGSTFQSITEVGGEIASYYGWVQEGIFQTQAEIDNSPTQDGAVPGDMKFADLNNDGVINEGDRKRLGSNIPDYIAGLQGSITYKNFDFSVSFQGVFGNEVYNNLNALASNFSSSANKYTVLYNNRWTGPGTSNSVPRVGQDNNNNYRVSSYSVWDGSFVRLKTMQIGYTLPEDIFNFIGATKVKVYASGQNLFTIDKYDIGLDPEVGSPDQNALFSGVDNGGYPQAKTFILGLNISF
ncbi:SusC/RagA family TonB-linked outer membrane protein [Aestuariibaculum marinum]|uniref:TonB-dependent receptor n=1 Tax=Aestuariibaculum marinum TaxID=2683592 RepID=A0A8J6Q4V6_9FLAO|nr:TonB-dependent receptor [Aestuariibaculum marinum]MBD0825435.1 TonB-dependent receptor [Aestuariibaculum marinum]